MSLSAEEAIALEQSFASRPGKQSHGSQATASGQKAEDVAIEQSFGRAGGTSPKERIEIADPASEQPAVKSEGAAAAPRPVEAATIQRVVNSAALQRAITGRA